MLLFLLGCLAWPTYTALPPGPGPAPDAPDLRLVLAGDGGLVEPGEGPVGLRPALTAAMRAAASAVPRAHVVWLGDNVYEAGVGKGEVDAAGTPVPGSRAAAILAAQIAAGPTPADVSFVPGNHDYLQVSTFRARLLREAALLRAAGARPRAYTDPVERWEPPGTAAILLFLDTERAIEQATAARVDQLAAVAAAAREGRPLVILGHHPIADAGPHGRPSGGFLLLDSELANPTTRTWAADLGAALGAAPALLVSGHDHTLQVLEVPRPSGPPLTQVISGSAAKGRDGPAPVVAPGSGPPPDARPGFVVVDLLGTRAWIRTVTVTPHGAPVSGQACAAVDGFPTFDACDRGWVDVDLGGGAGGSGAQD